MSSEIRTTDTISVKLTILARNDRIPDRRFGRKLAKKKVKLLAGLANKHHPANVSVVFNLLIGGWHHVVSDRSICARRHSDRTTAADCASRGSRSARAMDARSHRAQARPSGRRCWLWTHWNHEPVVRASWCGRHCDWRGTRAAFL